jgi:hypothetical protein
MLLIFDNAFANVIAEDELSELIPALKNESLYFAKFSGPQIRTL